MDKDTVCSVENARTSAQVRIPFSVSTLDELKKQWYFATWFEHFDLETMQCRKEHLEKMDSEAREFYTELMPKYYEYAGTKKLLPEIRKYLESHEIHRKDDFRLQLICMWCNHIRLYRERQGKQWKAEDVFKLRIPKIILSVI